MNGKRALLAVVSMVGLAVAYTAPASAVPMWSRRYGVPCSMCHQYPSLQLTADGLDFFRRGHRMKGDDVDKDIPNLISAHAEWSYNVEQGSSTAIEAPEFHLHAGGALSRSFSAYVDAGINEDFESLYGQYTKESGDGYFTARGGKLIPTIIRNYGNGLLASASTPLVLTDATLGDNPFTPARDSVGVDIGGRWNRVFVQAGVLNGEDVEGQAQVGNHKDFYASVELTQKSEPTGMGLYYHHGAYDLGNEEIGLTTDTYQRVGAFGNVTTDRFRLAGAYLYGKDDRAELPSSTLRGFYVQGDWHPSDWAAPFLRYDRADSDFGGGQPTDRVEKLTLGCAAVLFQTDITAGRIVVEASRRREAGEDTNAGLLNLLLAF